MLEDIFVGAIKINSYLLDHENKVLEIFFLNIILGRP